MASAISRCLSCDLIQRIPRQAGYQRLRCVRCNKTLFRRRKYSEDLLAACSIAALVFWMIAAASPFLTLEISGVYNTIGLFSGVVSLWNMEFHFLAVLVLVTSVLAPLAQLILLVGVLMVLRTRYRPNFLPLWILLVNWLSGWTMPGIFMVGTLVAAVKVRQMASLDFGSGFPALCIMVVLWLWIISVVEGELLFDLAEAK